MEPVLDTVKNLPYYAWLAASGAFIENHCSGWRTVGRNV
jgi:hypothetical protein